MPLPEPCSGHGVLPVGSAPWTSPVALLSYQNWNRLSRPTITFHLSSRAAHGEADAIATSSG